MPRCRCSRPRGSDRLRRDADLDEAVVVIMPTQNPTAASGDSSELLRVDMNRDWFARTSPRPTASWRSSASIRRCCSSTHTRWCEDLLLPPNADPIYHEITRDRWAG